MDIVIIGRGNVGRALGPRLRAAGHSVRHAVRNPSAADEIAIAGAGTDTDLVVLAIPFPAVAETVPLLGLTAARGTVLVDATNPFGRPLPDGVVSGAQLVAQNTAAGVPVVKAFNVMGAEAMADPQFPDGSPVMPVAGTDASAVATVVDLGRQIGLDAVPVGSLDAAGLMEGGARYWGLLAMAGGKGRDFALGALHR